MERNVFEIEMKDYKAYKSQFEPTLQNKGTLLTEEEKVMLENDYFNAAYEVKETTLENSYNDLNLGNGGKGILKKIKGRTLQNLCLLGEVQGTISDVGYAYKCNIHPIKYINKTVTLFNINDKNIIYEIRDSNNTVVRDYAMDAFSTKSIVLENNTRIHAIVIHAKNGWTDANKTELKGMVLEGDWTNKPIPPYFEGIKSVAEEGESLVVKSCGKNLFDGQLQLGNLDISSGLEIASKNIFCSKNFLKIKPATQYCIVSQRNDFQDTCYILEYDINKNYLGYISKPSACLFTTKHNTAYIKFRSQANGVNGYVMPYDISNCNIQLEEGTTATQYEHYTGDKSEILLQDLRGLDNNICDILDMESGKLTRNVGKIVLDGSETDWTLQTSANSTNSIVFNYTHYSIKLLEANRISTICDKFISKTITDTWFTDVEGISQSSNGHYLQLRILKSKLSSLDVVGLKAWLKANPVTVYYQLATPIVTQLSISDNKLELYRNGHIFVEGSLISPYIDLQYTTDSQIPIFEQYMLLEYPPNVLQKSPEFAKYIFSLNSMDIKLYYWDINYFKFVDYNPEIFFSKMEFDIPNKFEDTIYIMLETTRDFISANDLKMSLAIEKIRSIVEHMPHYIANSEVANNICSPIDIEIIKAELLIAEYTKQFVISTATFTLSRYEEQYNLPINPLGITIEERRSRVKAKMRSQGAVTKQMIRNVINSWTNAEIDIIEDYANYSVTIKFIDTVGIPSNVNDIYKAIDEIKPAHLNFIYEFKYNTVKDVRLKNWTVKELADKSKTVKQLIEEPL